MPAGRAAIGICSSAEPKGLMAAGLVATLGVCARAVEAPALPRAIISSTSAARARSATDS
eukprot:4808649-Prymnesium_polylepis.1